MSKEQEAKSLLEDYLEEQAEPKTVIKVVNAESPVANPVLEQEAKVSLEAFLEDNQRTKVVTKVVGVPVEKTSANPVLEQEVKSALSEFLEVNQYTKTTTKVVGIEVEKSSVNPVSKQEAKAALESFLEDNKRAEIVVVDNTKSNPCGGCPDKGKVAAEVFAFTYSISDLFEEVHKRSSYFGRNLVNKEGVSSIDAVAVTLDEYDIFLRLCKEGAAHLYLLVEGESVDLENAFLFNSGNDDKIVFLFAKKKDSFNFNLFSSIEVMIETAIVYYVLWQWYLTIGLESEVQKYYTLFELEKSKVETAKLNSKKKKTTRKYRWL